MEDNLSATEEERLQQLEEKRQMIFSVEDLAQRVAAKLNQMIAQGRENTAFAIAIFLAILKDGLDIGIDFFIVGEIPIIGQLPGLFISATLMYFLWGKGWFNRTKVKIILWGLGFLVDNLPFLINDLPMTTLTVFMAWHIIRKRARQAEKDLEKLHELTEEELMAIEQEE